MKKLFLFFILFSEICFSQVPNFPTYFNCADEHTIRILNYYCTNEDKSISILLSPTSYTKERKPDPDKPWKVTAQLNDGSGRCLTSYQDMFSLGQNGNSAAGSLCDNKALKLRSEVNFTKNEGFELCGFSNSSPDKRIFFHKIKWMKSINDFITREVHTGRLECNWFAIKGSDLQKVNNKVLQNVNYTR